MTTKRTLGRERLLRLYATLSQVNQSILRVSDPHTFYQQICQIATTFGKFKFAWIGIVDPDTLTVVPVAHSGKGKEYLEKIVVSVDPQSPASKGPTGRSILTGKPQVIHNFLTSRRTRFWAPSARRYGFKSAMGVSISKGGERIGALMLYAGEEYFFQRPEQQLLIEIASDISFALDFLQSQSLRRKAEEEMVKHQRQLDLLLAASLKINQLHKIDEVMREIIRFSLHLTGATKGLYGFGGPDALTRIEYFDGVAWSDPSSRFSSGKGLPAWGRTRQSPYISNDPLTDPMVSDQERWVFQHRNLLHVPILSPDQDYLGFIELHDKSGGLFFNAQDQVILSALSAHAAVAFENAHLLEAVRLSESELRLFKRSVESSTASLTIADAQKPDYPLTFVNDSFLRLTGYTAEEVLGKNCRFLQGNDLNQEGIAQIRSALKAGAATRVVLRNYQKDGTPFLNELSIFPVFSQNHVVTHFLGIQNNITNTVALQKSQDLSTHVFEMASDGILITDSSNQITHINRAFTEITGYTLKEVQGKNPSILSSGRHAPFFFQTMWQDLHSVGYWQGELWNRRKSGEVFPEWLSISTNRNEKGEIENYIGIFHDLTGIKASEERIAYLAYHDPLTGLPNRVLLRDRLEYALLQSRRNQRDLGILLLDLDGFKTVNDLMGHQTGDQLLIEVARRMTQTVRTSDSVCRMGGDEFLLVFPDLTDLQELSSIIDRLFTQIRSPFNLGEKQLSITASGGVTLYPHDNSEIDDLVRHADIAMYNAKNGGRNRVRYYERTMEGELRKQEQLRTEIRAALAGNQFFLLYQPQVNIEDGSVIGVEALLRWKFTDGSIRLPNDFLPAIEDDDLSIEIGRWVLSSALEQHHLWKKKGILLRIGVNISPRHFISGMIENDLKDLVNAYGTNLDCLELEITENTMIRDISEAKRIVQDSRKLGLRFALDDFGTGFTSLTTIKTLLPDTLKIDLSFLREMETDLNNRSILESIMMIGRGFHVTVIQEGVELEAEARVLRDLGCIRIQGYLVSRPVLPVQLESFLRDWETDKRWTRY